MGDRVSPIVLTSLANQSSAIATINSNFEVIADKLDELVSRTGEAPNQMEADLDFNSQHLYNLPYPATGTEPLRRMDSEIGTLMEYLDRAETAAENAEDSETNAAASEAAAIAAAASAAASAAAAAASAAAAEAAVTAAYPVGAIFCANVATDPSVLLGFGTWAAFGAGRVLVGYQVGDPDFGTLLATGGAKTHTLTVDEMPEHKHGVQLDGAAGVSNNAVQANQGQSVTSTATTATTNTGGGDPHNNIQPYIVVSMWVRTA